MDPRVKPEDDEVRAGMAKVAGATQCEDQCTNGSETERWLVARLRVPLRRNALSIRRQTRYVPGSRIALRQTSS
jgi:hypothetical protein